MTNSESVIQLIMNGLLNETTDDKGNVKTDYNSDMLNFRLFNVESENFPAWVSAHKNVISLAQRILQTNNRHISEPIARLMIETTMNNLVGITGLSSVNSEFLKMLLLDKQESLVKLESNGAKSIMDTIKQNTGQNNPMGHNEVQY